MNTSSGDKQARLLIVDDDSPHMTALCNTLEDAGYAVAGFTAPAAALESLRVSSFDAVLTDLVMPQLDGIAFLRAAQALDNNLVGIVMTGHGAVDTAIEAMKAGAIDYVLKPFKLSLLLPVLSRALEVRRMRLEIVELQRRLQEHVVSLEAANQELEAFSYSVSHDLRAPLRAITGFSSILTETYHAQLPAEAQRLLGLVIDRAQQMGRLIEDLLRFSQLNRQSLTKHCVSISNLVNEVVEELRQGESGRDVEVLAGNLPEAMVDASLMRHVVVNLLSNAFKFTRGRDKARIDVGSSRVGEESIYFVRDNGAGFDMHHADKLFGVFQRLHSTTEFEGTGVGLSLANRIVQRHGGRMWAEGRVNEGATFYFSLPVLNGMGTTVSES